MPKALITGISGQDGSNLAELLIGMGYEVHGIIRRHSVAESQEERIGDLPVNTYYGDLLDVPSLTRIVSEVMPDEIYNLGAMSHVRISFDMPSFTIQTNGLGVLNILEVYRNICPEAKFYQASSSEMFGNSLDEDEYQRESTPMHPVSPYGCAKLIAYSLVRHYRHAYGLFACNGILFNHSGPRRTSNFVIPKIVKTACQIKKGLKQKLELGNMDSYRDFGDSRDYVRGMYAIIGHDIPDDFVIATGQTHCVRDVCKIVFDKLDMDYRDYVEQNDKHMRPEELKYLRGDASKARETLGWEPAISFDEMISEIVAHWYKRV